MKFFQLVIKIRRYAILSLLLPLITINSCLYIYKHLGTFETYPNLDWNKKINEFSISEYVTIQANSERSFINCPEKKFITKYTTDDNQIIEVFLKKEGEISERLNQLYIKKKLTKVNVILTNEKNKYCIKNHKFFYFLFSKFNSIEKAFLNAKLNYTSGFTEVKNPYVYGDISISRTARYFPATLIFKPMIILSALVLILYWKNNLHLFNKFKNEMILENFSKKFFYFGILSAIFLILHAIFLGVDFDSKVFSKVRKLIITTFIFSEVSAQFFLTKSLLNSRKKIISFINPLILKIKVVFISIAVIATIVALLILALGDPSTSFKNILEWNYFSFLLVYYLLSSLLWRSEKNPVHTPEGA